MRATLDAAGTQAAPRSEMRPQTAPLLMRFGLALGLILPTIAFAEGISIDNAYVRAVPPGQPNSAAFMTLTNASGQDRALVAAESDAAEVVELHTHQMEDGMMQMRQIEQIDLPAGKVVTLAPGGLHVMLIGLTEALSPGDQVALTLNFDDGASQTLSLPVKRIDPSAMPAHKHH